MRHHSQIEMLAPVVAGKHVVTKEYLEDYVAGKVKLPVRAASTANLVGAYNASNKAFTATANGALVVDGVTPTTGDRLLVAGQTDKTQNGIYTVTVPGNASTAFVITRSEDFDVSAEIFSGVRIAVTEGVSNAGTMWKLMTPEPITLDSTSLIFAMDSQASGVAARVFTITGDASATQWTFSHNWGTRAVTHEIYNSTTGETETFDVKRVNTNDVQISCALPLGAGNDYTLILHAEA